MGLHVFLTHWWRALLFPGYLDFRGIRSGYNFSSIFVSFQLVLMGFQPAYVLSFLTVFPLLSQFPQQWKQILSSKFISLSLYLSITYLSPIGSVYLVDLQLIQLQKHWHLPWCKGSGFNIYSCSYMALQSSVKITTSLFILEKNFLILYLAWLWS